MLPREKHTFASHAMEYDSKNCQSHECLTLQYSKPLICHFSSILDLLKNEVLS